MTRAGKAFRRVTLVGLLAAAAGLMVLFVQAVSEVLSDPSINLIDAYWIGRLPWTAVGVDLVIFGATIAVASGIVAVLLAGGRWKRAGSLVALAVATFWWFLAMLPPPQAVPCESCPPPGSDPVAMAYSLPESAALLLLLPALIVGAMALVGPRSRGATTSAAAN